MAQSTVNTPRNLDTWGSNVSHPFMAPAVAPATTASSNSTPSSTAVNPANLVELVKSPGAEDLSYPGQDHKNAEQIANGQLQVILQKIQDLDKKISEVNENIKSHPPSEVPATLQKNLKDSTTQRKSLQKEARDIGNISTSAADDENQKSGSQSRKKILSVKIEEIEHAIIFSEQSGREKETEKLNKKLSALKAEYAKLVASIPSESLEFTSSSSQFNQPDQVAVIKKMVQDGEQGIDKISKRILALTREKPPGHKEDTKKLQLEMGQLQQENMNLRLLLKNTKAPADNGSDDETVSDVINSEDSSSSLEQSEVPEKNREQTQKFGPMFRRMTTARRMPKSQVDGSSPPDLRTLQEQTRILQQDYPEYKSHYFTQRGNEKIEDLEEQLILSGKNTDLKWTAITRMQIRIQKLNPEDKATHAERAKLKKELAKLRSEHQNELRKTSALLAEIHNIESIVLPPAVHSAKTKARIAVVDSFLATVKSKATKDLETIHTNKITALKNSLSTERYGKVMRWNLLAGVAGFGVSFLLPNTITRFAPSWYGLAIAPVVAASLHVLLATPTVKTLMASTWNSPALGEMNNYFKLKGSAWGDWWRGQEHEKKWKSKDPNATVKLTSAEKLQEGRAFSEIYWDRYKREDFSYFSYTAGYGIKAAVVAAFTSYFSGATMESKGVEAAMHGLMGALSGALYVEGQQFFRRGDPNAKEIAVPTPEIYAAEAAALSSYRTDIENKISELTAGDAIGIKFSDMITRVLNQELRKTEKALIIATWKSKPGGGGIWEHEFLSQFQKGALEDTLSEVIGRILSLYQVAGIGHLTAAWRMSSEPHMMFLGHLIAAIGLMAPPLGFTARGIFSGLTRASIQAISGDNHTSVVTQLRNRHVDDDGDVLVGSNDEDTLSEEGSESESVVVDMSQDDGIDEESSEDSWDGNPRERDELGY